MRVVGSDRCVQEAITTMRMSAKGLPKNSLLSIVIPQSEGGSREVEERVIHHAPASCYAEASERPTPPIVQCRKMKSQKEKAKEMAPPKTGPPKGRKKG